MTIFTKTYKILNKLTNDLMIIYRIYTGVRQIKTYDHCL